MHRTFNTYIARPAFEAARGATPPGRDLIEGDDTHGLAARAGLEDPRPQRDGQARLRAVAQAGPDPGLRRRPPSVHEDNRACGGPGPQPGGQCRPSGGGGVVAEAAGVVERVWQRGDRRVHSVLRTGFHKKLGRPPRDDGAVCAQLARVALQRQGRARHHLGVEEVGSAWVGGQQPRHHAATTLQPRHHRREHGGRQLLRVTDLPRCTSHISEFWHSTAGGKREPTSSSRAGRAARSATSTSGSHGP